MIQAPIFLFLFLFIILYSCSLYSFLLLHCLIDIFVMSTSWGIFMITWNSRYRLKNNFYLFWGASYLFYGFIILFHLLFYKGPGILNITNDLSTIFWIISGYYFSICFCFAIFYVKQPLNLKNCLWVLFFITSFLIGITLSGFFPNFLMENNNMNLFKAINEFLICLICIVSLKRISYQKKHFSLKVFSNIKLGLIFFTATQVLFIFETQKNSVLLFLCHFFKFCSFYYIYQVFIEMGISRPMNLKVNELLQKQKITHENEKNFRLLFENMKEGVAYHQIVTNNDGKPIDYIFLNINQSFDENTGLNRQDLIGQYFSKVLPNVYKDSVDWVKLYGDVALNGKSLQFEQYSDHLNRWFKISAFCPEKGYFATIIKDITQRKKNEIELKQKKDELEKRIKESSQEIFEKKLSLLKVKEDIKEFACVISHDLCEPLRGIYNLSNMLKNSSSEKTINKDMIHSLEQLSHLSQVTHDRVELIMGVLQKSQLEQPKNR